MAIVGERDAYIGFHVAPSVKKAAKEESIKEGLFLSPWLNKQLIKLLRERGYEIKEDV